MKTYTFGPKESRKQERVFASRFVSGVPVLLNGAEIGFVFDKFYGTYTGQVPNGNIFSFTSRKAAAEFMVWAKEQA